MNIKIHKIKGLSTIDYRKLTNLQGDLKTLNTENKTKLINVLKRRGFRAPVFVYKDNGGSIYLMDGHQRQAVMLSNDMNDDGSYEVPYVPIYAKDIQEAQAILLEITSQYGTLTQAGLDKYMTLAQLPVAETMEMVNFDSLHIPTDQEDAVESPDVVEDEAPEVSDNPPVSKLGEIYQLGRHRIMCADSTVKENVELLMNGEKADMVFTDPPYGYKYESNHQNQHDMLMNDDQFLDFIPALYDSLNENCSVYTCGSFQTISFWIEYIKGLDLDFKNIIVWKKNNWSMGDLKGAYAGQHELIIYSVKGRVELRNGRDRDVWEFDREPPTLHPTMKPIELVSRAIKNTSDSGSIVLDSFLGSGSTLIACEQTDRTCYGMELDPKYVDVIRKRYHRYVAGSDEGWEDATQAI